ncbi:MAG: TlpA disulfide reductase family protein [Bacteroidota bacterium]
MQTKTEKFFAELQPKQVLIHLIFCSLAALLMACTKAESANTKTESITTNKQADESQYENQYDLGKYAPDFALQDLEGKVRSLKDYKGKFLVLHFATTWCPFCNAEAPSLEKISQAYKEQGVEVMIIDVKEDAGLVEEKLQKRFNFSFPLLLDPDGKVAASYAPEAVLPDLTRDEVVLASNLLIDPQGNIQFYSLLDSKDFDAELIALQKRLNELL